jgi:hypothetical protein
MGIGALGCQWMLDGEAQVLLAPVVRGRCEHELAQRSPAGRQVAECPEDPEYRVGLGGAIGRHVVVAEGAERQILRTAQDERPSHDALIRLAPGGVETGMLIDVEAAKLGLRVGDPELVFEVLSHRDGAGTGNEATRI